MYGPRTVGADDGPAVATGLGVAVGAWLGAAVAIALGAAVATGLGAAVTTGLGVAEAPGLGVCAATALGDGAGLAGEPMGVGGPYEPTGFGDTGVGGPDEPAGAGAVPVGLGGPDDPAGAGAAVEGGATVWLGLDVAATFGFPLEVLGRPDCSPSVEGMVLKELGDPEQAQSEAAPALIRSAALNETLETRKKRAIRRFLDPLQMRANPNIGTSRVV